MKKYTPELGLIAALGGAVLLAVTSSGCMQITGIKHMDAWGLKIDSTQGFDVNAEIMQYDGADNRKSMNKQNVARGDN